VFGQNNVMSENNYSVKTTEELQEIVDMIQQILEERSEVVPDVAVGDTVEFDLRKGCTVRGTITSKTDKRAKVTCSAVEGIYQIALKKIRKV